MTAVPEKIVEPEGNRVKVSEKQPPPCGDSLPAFVPAGETLRAMENLVPSVNPADSRFSDDSARTGELCLPHLRKEISLPLPPVTLLKDPAVDREGGPVKQRILLIDDTPRILDVTSYLLNVKGYEVVCAGDGATGIIRYAGAMKNGLPFDAVITDLVMSGGLDGKETLSRLQQIDPAVCVILSSGYADHPVMADFEAYGFRGILRKPYRIQELYACVKSVL